MIDSQNIETLKHFYLFIIDEAFCKCLSSVIDAVKMALEV